MSAIRIAGAGPAGSAAAIAALREGAKVDLYEPSRVPRHKVCGEFLSPEALPILERLGVLDRFTAARPARITRLALHFGTKEKRARLPEAACGFSRYALDRLLLDRAAALGAQVRPERISGADVLAAGRPGLPGSGERLFGFKAHFAGPASDVVELFFVHTAYVGVSAVEGGVTNVCGLAPERLLRRHGFEFDALVRSWEPLAERIRPLERQTRWFVRAPIHFERRLPGAACAYPAGDALGFIDPFTGSGILNALMTGAMAGAAAARRTPVEEYLDQARRTLRRPFEVASFFRAALASGWAERLIGLVPAWLLFRLTRPSGHR